MRFIETILKGAYIIELDPVEDERGFFARSYCRDEFRKNGIEMDIVQCNVSHNRKKGTLRGMHYQEAPYEEAKLISCIKGSMYDVIVDIRKGSPTFGKWTAVELTAGNGRTLYVPKGFAHGFQTLADDTVVYYHISEAYYPESSRGIRWDDPALGITWPAPNPIISVKDRNFSLFDGDKV